MSHHSTSKVLLNSDGDVGLLRLMTMQPNGWNRCIRVMFRVEEVGIERKVHEDIVSDDGVK